jgi:hypothetical protein
MRVRRGYLSDSLENDASHRSQHQNAKHSRVLFVDNQEIGSSNPSERAHIMSNSRKTRATSKDSGAGFFAFAEAAEVYAKIARTTLHELVR